MCKISGQKLNAPSRISTFLNKDKKMVIFNAMIKTQFSCCHLTWMFSSRQSNNLKIKVLERSLSSLQMMKIAVLKLCFKIIKTSQFTKEFYKF